MDGGMRKQTGRERFGVIFRKGLIVIHLDHISGSNRFRPKNQAVVLSFSFVVAFLML